MMPSDRKISPFDTKPKIPDCCATSCKTHLTNPATNCSLFQLNAGGILLSTMPTKQHQHRYSITATPEVVQALNALKAELGVKRLRLSELLAIGANEELTRIRKERSNLVSQRAELAQRIQTGQLGYSCDLEAAQKV